MRAGVQSDDEALRKTCYMDGPDVQPTELISTSTKTRGRSGRELAAMCFVLFYCVCIY